MEVLLENNEIFKVNEKGLLYSYTNEELINLKFKEVQFSKHKQVTGTTMSYNVEISRIALVLIYENNLSVLVLNKGEVYFFREEAVLLHKDRRF